MLKIISFLFIFSITLTASGSLFSKDMTPDRSDTCGLGWYVTDKKTLLGTSTRGIVNYLVPSNTSAMTSGTSGCARHDIVMKERETQYYVEANHETIVVEVAQGGGVFSEKLAGYFGCADSQMFVTEMQKSYERFSLATESAKGFYFDLKNFVRSNKKLNTNCKSA